MPGKLKPLDVQRAKEPGRYADGDGLYLIIAGPTSKNWSFEITSNCFVLGVPWT
jgi:hypothetical protein